ncbi:MAG: nitrate reductase molybdenum cofactor assembly chaperone [Chloroflexota bacterium]
MKLPVPWRAGRLQPPYKLISVLLQYPDAALAAAQEELHTAVTALPRGAATTSLEQFWRYWEHTSPLAREQRYVETFDLQKRTSLYLTFYLYGETRKRGIALLRLKRMYAAAGLPLEAKELPDYLPAMLEFAALAPAGYGQIVLEEFRSGLELLRLSLQEQKSPYRFLIDATCAGLRPLTPLDLERIRTLAVEGPPQEQVGLEPFAPPEVMPGVVR